MTVSCCCNPGMSGSKVRARYHMATLNHIILLCGPCLRRWMTFRSNLAGVLETR